MRPHSRPLSVVLVCCGLLAACGNSGAGGGATPSAGSGAGGSQGFAGTLGVGGTPSAAGALGTAGASAGSTSAGGSSAVGEAGAPGDDAAGASAGTSASGGSAGVAGSGGAGAAASLPGPCDIYRAGNTPCVAAHSTVRALYAAYAGNLYRVTRASDKSTKDIAVLSRGGFADAAAQKAFCAGTSCTISILYDQSGQGNHLTSAPGGGFKPTPDNEADAMALELTVGGHTVYGLHNPAGVGYRNDKTSGVATGDDSETMYMVTSGDYVNDQCCFDYGNAETDNHDDGAGTMEAIYFGTSTRWGQGTGAGPWVMSDLENGLYAQGNLNTNSNSPPFASKYVTALVRGKSGGTYGLKGGNAQSGSLKTLYDGPRPGPSKYSYGSYVPMRKQGAIILGIGGDNSNSGQGNFFEGAITGAAASDGSDDAVQANIVAAGYGK